MTLRVRLLWLVVLSAIQCVSAQRACAQQTEIEPAPTAQRLTSSEGSTLTRDFDRAQSDELAALFKRQKFELQQIDQRQGEWVKNEEKARHAYFKDHKEGSMRRTYVKDYLARFAVLRAQIKADHEHAVAAFEAIKSHLKTEQQEKRKLFVAALKRGERPPADLWPQSVR